MEGRKEGRVLLLADRELEFAAGTGEGTGLGNTGTKEPHWVGGKH